MEEVLAQTDLGQIHGRITATAQEVSHLRGEFAAAKSTLDLIHQFLLERRP